MGAPGEQSASMAYQAWDARLANIICTLALFIMNKYKKLYLLAELGERFVYLLVPLLEPLFVIG